MLRYQQYPSTASCFQVQRALLGDVKQTSGYLLTKARDLKKLYMDCFSVLQGWRIADISPSINIVAPTGILGKPTSNKLRLSEAEMMTHKAVN